MYLTKKDTQFKALASASGKCGHCGNEIPRDRMLIPGHYPGGPGGMFVGSCCWSQFEDEAFVSDDGLVISHQIIVEDEEFYDKWATELDLEMAKLRIDQGEMTTKIVEKETGITIREVVTNRSLTFDEACELAGLKWKEWPAVDTDGWYKGDTLWDESVAELISE